MYLSFSLMYHFLTIGKSNHRNGYNHSALLLSAGSELQQSRSLPQHPQSLCIDVSKDSNIECQVDGLYDVINPIPALVNNHFHLLICINVN